MDKFAKSTSHTCGRCGGKGTLQYFFTVKKGAMDGVGWAYQCEQCGESTDIHETQVDAENEWLAMYPELFS